jgi:dolichyl-phosphate beta-glucosyltransferase
MTTTGAANADRSLGLSVVLPAYNEEARIRPTLEGYATHFAHLYRDGFEVLVVLNGCTDDTRAVVDAVARAHPQVRAVEFPQPLGKGGAIWEGLALARGARLLYADADNMVEAPEAALLVRALDTHDVAIANRFARRGGGGGQPLLRRVVSVLSRLWVRAFLGLPYADTQCGAKAFRAPAWRTLAPHVREHGWAFDLEVLAQAQRAGLRVSEVPVRWHHIAAGSKVRPWRDVPATLWATLRIKRRAR